MLRLSLMCDLISFLLISTMLSRTFMYIMKRRSGSVGPSMAPVLVRFWAVHGAVQFIYQVLHIYLAPFHGKILISFVRAPLLVLLCYGRRLPVSCHVYQTSIAPFYESNEPEIEERLQRARTTKSELDEAFRQLAVYLLQRMAAGGLSNIIPIPRFNAIQPVPSVDVSSPPRKEKEKSNPLPLSTAVFPSSRNFFGGESDHRVRTVFAANRDNLGGAIQPNRVSEMPKAAYDNLRAFRKQLRDRLKKTTSDTTKAAPG
ncbi:unnamed protein product [Agarophyton chilense]